MTQIKKFGLGAIATALFAALSVSMVSATVTAIDMDSATVGDQSSVSMVVNNVITVTVDTSAATSFVRAELQSGNAGIQFVGGDVQQAVGNVATFQLLGTSAGQSIVRFTDLSDGDTEVGIVTVTGVAAGTATALDIQYVTAGEDGITASSSGSANEIPIAIRAEDANGAVVTSQTQAIIVTTSHGSLATASGACPGASTQIVSLVAGVANLWFCPNTASGAAGSGDAAINASLATGTGLTAATETITVSGAASDIEVVLASDIDLDAPASLVTVTVKDSEGRLVSGTVSIVAGPSSVCTTAGITNPVTLVKGVANGTVVAQGASGNCIITATSGTSVGTAVEIIGQASPTQPGDGSFAAAPNFGSGNVGSAVFNGGSIADLADATADADGTGVWVQGTDGNWYRYTVGATGATAFVNNAFNAQFEDGFAGATAVFVVK